MHAHVRMWICMGLQESKINTCIYIYGCPYMCLGRNGTLMIVLDQLIERRINIIFKKRKVYD
jgi:hypothetical protein